ncbi:Pca regulon regulatory protein PcaR [Klebsiella pneumoniae]|nr:Pca regulon regulatory protein PcaR [Klebsiella pneumoniae]
MDKHPDDLLTGDGDPFKGDPNFMASLARGLEVIQAFTPQRPLLSISQISQKTGIPRAAVRRCLYTLSKLGFVYAEDGKNFQLRPRILALGHAWLASTPLARSAQPVLRHLSEMLNESCSIATLDGDDILYIARASSSRIMTIDLDIGSRLPAWATSMGRVLLSHQPEEKAQRYAGPGDHDPLYPTDGGFGGEAARRTETGASAGVCPQRSGAGDGAALPRGPAV